eukprot:SAG31_NODE_748_length_12390_cov_6.306484_7_plen_91_part_00
MRRGAEHVSKGGVEAPAHRHVLVVEEPDVPAAWHSSLKPGPAQKTQRMSRHSPFAHLVRNVICATKNLRAARPMQPSSVPSCQCSAKVTG